MSKDDKNPPAGEEKKVVGENRQNLDQSAENAFSQDEIEKLKQERDEYLNGWKRAKADMINYKKEEVKRLEEVARYGTEKLIGDLILVLDSFELGIRSMESNAPPGGIDKGVYIIKSQIEEVLKKQGLSKIKVSPGDAFLPTCHESLGEIESDSLSGTVAVEIEAGYRLNGKVVRPARVKLAK